MAVKKKDGGLLARMAQRVQDKDMAPDSQAEAQRRANEETAMHPIRLKRRDQHWYKTQALKSGKTIAGVAREALRREFGDPPEGFNAPLKD